MRDLYSTLGISPFASESEIRTAIHALGSDPNAKKAFADILLVPRRKLVYDRHHLVLCSISRLRSEMGLLSCESWQNHASDFSPTKRSTRSKRQTSTATQSTSTPPDILNRSINKVVLIIINAIAALIIVLSILVAVLSLQGENKFPQNAATSPKPPTHPSKLAKLADRERFPARTTVAPGNSPPKNTATAEADYFVDVPEPLTGVVNRDSSFALALRSGAPLAPLQVKARRPGPSFFLKLVYASTGETAATYYIRQGATLDADVPLGSYRIKYASGLDWYGSEKLFGPTTIYSQVDEAFTFSQTQSYGTYTVSGYTLELYKQVGGNLDTRSISAKAFVD